MLTKINTLSGYLYEYQKSVANPEDFWDSVAQQFYWRKTWDKVVEWNFENLDVKWFIGGKLNITENILAGVGEIREKSFPDLIDRYYQEVQQRKSQDESCELLEAIAKLRYATSDDRPAVGRFALIQDEPDKYDVFIEQDDTAARIWQQFTALKEIPDPFERRHQFQQIKPGFYQYIISVPQNIGNQPELVGEIGYVKKSLLKDYYDEQTGFIVCDPRAAVIF
jgi:hypothetical protein